MIRNNMPYFHVNETVFIKRLSVSTFVPIFIKCNVRCANYFLLIWPWHDYTPMNIFCSNDSARIIPTECKIAFRDLMLSLKIQ